MPKNSLVIATVCALLIGVPAGEVAAKYPPRPPPTCDVSPRSGHPGKKVSTYGDHWKHYSLIHIFFDQVSRGLTEAGGGGSFVAYRHVPGGASKGLHHWVFKGRNRAGAKARCAAEFDVVKK